MAKEYMMINTNYRAQSPAFGQKLCIRISGGRISNAERSELQAYARDIKPANSLLFANIKYYQPSKEEKRIYGDPPEFLHYKLTLQEKGNKAKQIFKVCESMCAGDQDLSPVDIIRKELCDKLTLQRKAK